ncbi:hypothetical protein [Paractinoplanes toevensis]|nr:hypothetical protein [Actinoplanes toevensis]
MTDPKTPVWVTIAVHVGGETKTFEADATTASNPYEIANGLLSGLHTEASRTINRQAMDYSRSNR